MMTKKILLPLILLLGVSNILSQNEPGWIRYPAISPDGERIVFSYKGDLYQVASSGGPATPLTLHEAYDFSPVWSHDGRHIAFASNRYGNFDVFLVPADGGAETRLSFHSSNDLPSDFTVDDQEVIFSSSRIDDVANMQFPSGALSELYSVPVTGGRVKQLLTTPAEVARYNRSGDMLVYQDKKGYEDNLRKHHTSSVTRDIWTYHFTEDTFIMLTSFEGEDRNPVFDSSQDAVFYLSEEDGNSNIYRIGLTPGAIPEQLTGFVNHPVRHLSASDEDVLCFSWHGKLFTKLPGQDPDTVPVTVNTGNRFSATKIIPVSGNIRDMALSPNGKEIAFIFRGEVFVTSVEGAMTKRITNTPEQERNPTWHPEGRKILYASERDNSWNLYQTRIAMDVDKYFFLSTLLEEEVILESDKETFQPAYSPDGKEVAYLEERTTLKVINLETKATRTIMAGNLNYSYADGDQYYQWSPDSKWFFVEFLQPEQWIPQAGLVHADSGNAVHNLTMSGYSNVVPKWQMNGKIMLWFSDRHGMRSHGSWGSQDDVYAMFLTQDAYDQYRLSKEEYAILKEEKKKEKNDKVKSGKEKSKKEEKDSLRVEIDWRDLRDRKERLTIHSSALSDALISKDGEKLYYLARFEKGYDLWETNLRTRETKILVKLGASYAYNMQLDKKGENLFLLAGGKIVKIKLKEKKKENIDIKTEMVLNAAEEREYMFEHMWRQVLKKFYVKDLHGVDWEFYRKEYEPKLKYIDNNYDFAEMVSELLGELNASHTGCGYRYNDPNGDRTAGLGLFFDESYGGTGLKIAEVMDKSPVIQKDSKIKDGVIIEKIDGTTIEADDNYYPLLNRKAGKYMLLSLFSPQTGERWDEKVKAISFSRENQLRYERWVKNSRKMVDELSGGKIGYVHVRSMGDASFRTVFEEALGRNHGKEALVVDTRFNGGGWLHDDLATFLDGEVYITFMPRGQNIGSEPQFKWTKPSIVVMSESNYSDAHMFPFAYKELGIGKLVGMPVPGTGTAVWWETLQDPSVYFGIPQVGMMSNDGYYLENTQLEPDIRVAQDPGVISEGQDQQLEAAVNDLLQQINQ